MEAAGPCCPLTQRVFLITKEAERPCLASTAVPVPQLAAGGWGEAPCIFGATRIT